MLIIVNFLAIYLFTQRKTGISALQMSRELGVSDMLRTRQFNWVNTLLGNVKNAITGTYHAGSRRWLSLMRNQESI